MESSAESEITVNQQFRAIDLTQSNREPLQQTIAARQHLG
jgi:hypothetical protein